MKNTDLSIIIVNWKVANLVSELLHSIAKETKGITYEIFVVDNDSGDGIEDVVKGCCDAYPDADVKFIQNEENLGFAKANNIAISQASGRYVVLLNPDTRLRDNALRRMVEWMDTKGDIGVAGPKLLNADGSVQPSVRRFPTMIDQAMILLKLHHLWRRMKPLRKYFADDFDYDKETDVDQVMGAAFFVRKEVFEKIGLLDEQFFIWFEEVDFCKRAKEAGYRVVYTPVAEVVHHGGTSFAKAMTVDKQRYFNDSMEKYFRKHRGAMMGLLLLIPLTIGLGLAIMISLWRKSKKSGS